MIEYLGSAFIQTNHPIRDGLRRFASKWLNIGELGVDLTSIFIEVTICDLNKE